MLNPYQNVPSKPRSFISIIFKLFFQAIHILLSLDFGFFRHGSLMLRTSLRIFLFLKLFPYCVWIIMIMFSDDGSKIFWLIVTFFHNLINILILASRKTNQTVCYFFYELRDIDKKLQLKDNTLPYLQIKVVLSLLFCLIWNVLFVILFCGITKRCSNAPLTSIIFLLSTINDELIHVCYAHIFYSVYCQLKKLSFTLETSTERLDYVAFQFVYKSLVDITEKYKSSFDVIYAISLLFSIPGLMFLIYSVVEESMSIRQFLTLHSLTMFAEVLVSFVLLLAPAMSAGMLTSQADQIIVILHDKLLQQQDDVQIRNIKRFIRYVEERGFRFRVYKVIPLDADLLRMVLGFCVTYLIVIIQFTQTSSG